MALSMAQAQSVSNFLHYIMTTYCLNNEDMRNNCQNAMKLVDAELKVQGGTPDFNPKKAG